MKDINSLTDNKSWFELPTGPTGVRPSNPVAGQMRYDTTENVVEYYNPAVTGWRSVSNAPVASSYVTAAGGTITTDGDYKIHTFTSSSNFIVSHAGEAAGSNTVELLLVAGGGSGGVSAVTGHSSSERGGGGGAGGYRTFATISLSALTYAIVVGAGGTVGANGGDSSALGYSSTGGGAGAYHWGSYPAAFIGEDGGSGGGGMWANDNQTGGKGTGNAGSYSPAEGNDGGLATGGFYGGGGGGSGGAGTDSVSGTGGGGAGTTNTISGGSVTYAAGGDVATAVAGTANRGNGGSSNLPNTWGAINGGSGIIIIRYKFQN